ncbi:hypothetical protein BH23BAC3_BH23BAC3_14730 [soil metagenome]
MNKIIKNGNRIRESSTEKANLSIDKKTYENVKHYFNLSEKVITQRINELDKEWDIERVLSINMSTLALTGLILSVKDRKWLALPTVVLGFFAQHSIQGWCPPLTVLRFLKFRTRKEIDQEKHALKVLRGDYSDIHTAEEAFRAVKK